MAILLFSLTSSVAYAQPTTPAEPLGDKPEHPIIGESDRPVDDPHLFKQQPTMPLGSQLEGQLGVNPIDGQLLPTFDPRPPLPPIESLPPEHPESPESTISGVLERPEFNNKERRLVWRRKDFDDVNMPEMPAFLQAIFEVIATGIQGILWVAAGAALAGLLILIFSRFRRLGPRDRSKKKALPKPQVGRLEPEAKDRTLPKNIPAAAWKLWEQGRHDEALGLLYRGALAGLVEELALEIEENATEGECLRTVRADAPAAIADFFAAITRAWQEVAYAHRHVEDQRIRDLCTSWPAHFGATS